jgi:hypothetical protein
MVAIRIVHYFVVDKRECQLRAVSKRMDFLYSQNVA